MAEVGDRQRCTQIGCRGAMVLRTCRPAAAIPQQIGSGQPFPTTGLLQVWMCELDPKHVEVLGWETRPVKECSIAGCNPLDASQAQAAPQRTPRGAHPLRSGIAALCRDIHVPNLTGPRGAEWSAAPTPTPSRGMHESSGLR